MLHRRRAVDENSLGAIVDLLDEDDLVVLEHNRIDGIVSLYGMPAPVELVASRAANLLRLDQQPNEPGGSRMAIHAAYMGTVQLRGNHLVSLSIGFALLESIVRRSDGEATFVLDDDVCARLLLDGNVIEGVANLTLSRSLIAQANSFTAMAVPRGKLSITDVASVASAPLGWCLADAATFIGNQGSGQAQHGHLFDISRFAERVANLFIQIT